MAQFMIEIPHDDEHRACVQALDAISRSGSHLMTNARWGCAQGHHAGYLMIELDDRASAERMIPPQFRDVARVVEVQQFTREHIEDLIADLEATREA